MQLKYSKTKTNYCVLVQHLMSTRESLHNNTAEIHQTHRFILLLVCDFFFLFIFDVADFGFFSEILVNTKTLNTTIQSKFFFLHFSKNNDKNKDNEKK